MTNQSQQSMLNKAQALRGQNNLVETRETSQKIGFSDWMTRNIYNMLNNILTWQQKMIIIFDCKLNHSGYKYSSALEVITSK